MAHRFEIKAGHTLTVIVTHNQLNYEFQSITGKLLKCERLDTGSAFGSSQSIKREENLAKYWEWYKGFIESSCKGRPCPHYGTEMLEKDGRLVCPMHHLTAAP